MKQILTLLIGFFVLFSCNNVKNESETVIQNEEKVENSEPNFGIVIHGGAGGMQKRYLSDSIDNAFRLKLKEAITTGHIILENGGTSIEAITTTINIMEDSPLFNAGKGAVFTHEVTNELDASIMDGATLNAGAVAGVKRIKNPINLALSVMNDSPHVLLAGAGAEQFALDQGYELVDPSYFYTDYSYKSLQKVKEAEANKTAFHSELIKNSKFGTVGCAALDKHGNLAAGTSTGGMTNKRWNRIGDAPIIGAGTYANNATCAVSSTGWGEFFIRAMVAHDISALMEYKGLSLEEAAKEVIQKKVPELGGDGGIVAIDKEGNIAMEFNTPGMFRAHMNAEGELIVKIYQDE